MSTRLSCVWLSQRPGVGPRAAAGLLRAFGTAQAVYAAGREQLASACPLHGKQLDALCDKDTGQAERMIEACSKKNIQIITIGDSAYPDRLRAICDPPLVLYVRGRWPDFDVMPGISVVGTRKATSYGLKTAEELGTALAQAGFITVSGMALGNDGAAHRGALRAGGLTVAVLAGGVDICYPPQHRALMGDILLSGALVSENPPGTEPAGRLYHSRNRIVSGLSVATVIVEARDYRSGALITARHALDQGRDVYAVPGTLDAPQSAACNELIEKGEAALLSSPASLIRAYKGILSKTPLPFSSSQSGRESRPSFIGGGKRSGVKAKASAALPANLQEDERAIALLVQQGVSSPAELVERSGMPAPRVMSLVTMLEVNGVIRREKGMLVIV